MPRSQKQISTKLYLYFTRLATDAMCKNRVLLTIYSYTCHVLVDNATFPHILPVSFSRRPSKMSEGH